MTLSDFFPPTVFIALWAAHAWLVESSPWRGRTLSAAMEEERRRWAERLLTRDFRIVDASIIGGLQNGTAFFASTSLLAIGGAFALFNNADRLLTAYDAVAIAPELTRGELEIRILGLLLLYAYAFFKFSWAYRLFNYVSILIAAAPMVADARPADEMKTAVDKVAKMSVAAAREFNRGQRAFLFSIGYLGWFFGAATLIAGAALTFAIMAARQFASPALAAVAGNRKLLDE
ncbi:MAG: DUF599 family protein [Pseudomonadota bacterium]